MMLVENSPITRKERLDKFLARVGICSRREAECLLLLKRVSINNNIITNPATTLLPTDVVTIDGIITTPISTRLWCYNKPRGMIVTYSDPECRPSIFETLDLTRNLPRIMSIGRLDLMSEGLLLLTNNSLLVRQMESPENSLVRRYYLHVRGTLDPLRLKRMQNGSNINSINYGPIISTLNFIKGTDIWLTISVYEGKNREIRCIMSSFGWKVIRLIRVAYGPFKLRRLASGEMIEVSTKVLYQRLHKIKLLNYIT